MTPIERVSIKSKALAVLGLNNTTATDDDIRLAYRACVREKHPDRCQGNANAFLRITDAFKFLCGESDEFDPNASYDSPSQENARPVSRTPRPTMDFTPKSRTRSTTLSRPVSKPIVQETETKLSEIVLTACKEELGDQDGFVATHQTRKGRGLSFMVPVKILQSANKVAVPSGDLFDTRKTNPIVLNIYAADISGGSYKVPADVVDAHFPGAHRVEICFVADV
jgi:hypothetical protein